MILLDTNVVSEPMRVGASPVVLRWLNLNFPDCAISSVVIFEILSGIGKLPRGKRRQALERAAERMIQRFGNRIYQFDEPSARASATLMATARSRGRTLHIADLQIAGIAAAHGLTLATRNTRDFAGFGINVVDPWSDP